MFSSYLSYAMGVALIAVCLYAFVLKSNNFRLTDENQRLHIENESLLALNSKNDLVCRKTLDDYDRKITETLAVLEKERINHNKAKMLINEMELRRFDTPEGNYNCSISIDATDPILRRLNND